MNHQQRARNLLRRVLAPRLHKSDLFELLELEVVQGLQQAERDGWRAAVRRSGNLVGEMRRTQVDVAIRDLIFSMALRVFELEKER